MGFGILEDRYLKANEVPGTAFLSDERVPEKELDEFKRAKGRNGHILLVPQPSDDPNDPLNWPRWKKECLFWSLCLAAGLAGSIGHLLNAGFKEIASQWNVSVNAVAATNADLDLALGCFTLVQGSLAIKLGRRPMFIFASLCQVFTCIWAARSMGIKSFKAARILQGSLGVIVGRQSGLTSTLITGFGMAPYEALVTASIGDVFFVHERGFRVAVWNFAIGGAVALLFVPQVTPIINGFVIQSPNLGWRWTFWIIMIAFGFSLVCTIFLMPETMYDRPKDLISGAALARSDLSDDEAKVKTPSGDIAEIHVDEKESIKLVQEFQTSIRRKTFLEELKPWSYTSDASLLRTLVRPFVFLFSPPVWFTFFAYGCTTVWLVVVSVIYSLVFGSAPYFFDSTTVGLISIGPFIGTIFGTVIAGPLSDWSVKWAARRNKGIYEPEFRLFLLVPMFVLDIAGYVGWAVMQPKGLPWIGPVVMYSMISAGQCVGSTAVCTYLIDVHRKNTPECFAMINFLKNMILYAFTLFVNGWVIELGILRTFGMLAALTAFCIMTGMPMYIFGKRARSFVHRYPKLFLAD